MRIVFGAYGAAAVGIIVSIATAVYVGKYAISKFEEGVRSSSRWYQPTEGPHIGGEWVDGTDDDLGKARLFGGLAGLAAGAAAGLASFHIARKIQGN